MTIKKCKNCGATGFKFCSHGKKSKKTYITHLKDNCMKKKFVRRAKKNDK